MKDLFKGCLISIFMVFLMIVGATFYYTKTVRKRLILQNSIVEKEFQNFKKLIISRNDIISKIDTFKIDYPKFNKSVYYLNEYFIDSFIENEYLLNNLTKNILQNKVNKELNEEIIIYNKKVKEFNFNYSIFPNFFIGKRQNLHRREYLYIVYGEDNEELREQRRKTQEWIKNGGTLE